MSNRPFVVEINYEIWEKDREAYLEAMAYVRENAMEIGAVGYLLYEDDDQPNRFTEVMTFESWSHYKRVQARPVSAEMDAVYERIAAYTIGAEADTTVRHLRLLEA
jgi:quinol monooxygenase YgiN